jgi:hypothetical protein
MGNIMNPYKILIGLSEGKEPVLFWDLAVDGSTISKYVLFTYALFNDVASSSHYIASNGRMIS